MSLASSFAVGMRLFVFPGLRVVVVGRFVVGRLVVGRLVVGRLVVGRFVVGRLVVGRFVVGRLVVAFGVDLLLDAGLDAPFGENAADAPWYTLSRLPP